MLVKGRLAVGRVCLLGRCDCFDVWTVEDGRKRRGKMAGMQHDTDQSDKVG
jgi:hypothetical protein